MRAEFSLSLDNKIDLYGMRIIIITRASFLVPFDVLSLTAGLTKIKFRHFLLGTLIGIIPEMISWGEALAIFLWWGWVIVDFWFYLFQWF